MRGIRLVYLTAADSREAQILAQALVEKKLVACVNILSEVKSVYRWKGQVEQTTEVVLVAKTTRTRFPALLKLVKALHSYDVPCVVSIPIETGNPDFLKWVAAQTATTKGPKRAVTGR